MKIHKYKKFFICIMVTIIASLLMGCGNMPHSNPLDPDSPDYKPPPPPAFTSIAVKWNEVWFGSNGGGLVSFDGYDWNKYTKAEGLPDDRIESVVAQGGNIWFTVIGQNQKIYSFDGQKVKEYPIPPVVSISADEYHIWIGSENEIGTYDLAKDAFIWYQLPEGGQVATLAWDGVFVWTAIQQSVDKIKSVEIAKFSPLNIEWFSAGYLPLLSDETLLDIALDRDIIWFGTSRGDVKQFLMLNERAVARTQIGISPSGSGCIAADESLVWFGYGNRGLIRYHKITGTRESFLEGEIVYGIAITMECVWTVTNTGAHCYEKQPGIWKKFDYPKFETEEGEAL